MITRNDIVAEARKRINTPYTHQGRSKEHGLDCIGLIIDVCKSVELIDQTFDINGYSRVPDGRSLIQLSNKYMTLISKEEMSVGDVVVITFDKDPQHFGFVADYVHGGFSIIHAASKHNKVVETRLLFTPTMKFVAAYKLPGM